jgi:dTDP-glucose pyrophosphorylase
VPDPLALSTVPESGTVRDAMRALDRSGSRIALAVDPAGRLVGVATDGDLRRALLAGALLDGPIAPHLTRSFVSVTRRDGRADVLELMRARRIENIPVLDDDGRPVALHLLHEFLETTERDEWALIMAGGKGRRLRPLTDDVPKPMLHVAGRPILERLVVHLVGFGIKRMFISTNYLGHLIEEHFGDGSRYGCRIEYLREDRPLGTAGALGLLPEPPAVPVLLLNGDLVTSADIGAFLDAHRASEPAATIGVRRYLHTVPFGCVERDGERVLGIAEKPVIEREVAAGMYVLGPAAVGVVAPGTAIDMPDVITTLLERGERVHAFEIEDDWIDIGQREQLERARSGT